MPTLGPNPEFSWSFSRHGTFETCRRQYYWQYYGSWQGWPTGDGDATARKAYLLNKITTPAMVIGTMTHNAIGTVLREWTATETLFEIERVRQNLDRSSRRRAKESREGAWKASPKKFTHFFDDYYGDGVSEEQIQKMAEDAQSAVNTFYETFMPTIQTQPGRNCAVVDEDIEKCKTSWEGVNVFVMPDLVWLDGGRVYVYDWKTGKARDKDRTQVVGYACWLHDTAAPGLASDGFVGRIAYLNTGETAEVEVDTARMGEFRTLARESMTKMRASLDDPEGNIASVERFPMTEDNVKCRWCKFKELCSR